jgi:hypothetical protein
LFRLCSGCSCASLVTEIQDRLDALIGWLAPLDIA